MRANDNKKDIKVNLGCGTCWHPDWVNLDGSPATRLIWLRRLRAFNWCLPSQVKCYPLDLVRWDLRKVPLPLESDCASFIFSQYALEYLTAAETSQLLKDCYRVMKPGGIIRLSMVDVYEIVDRYHRQYQALPRPEAVEATRVLHKMSCPEQASLRVRVFRRGGVQQELDKASIGYLLNCAGFGNIVYFDMYKGRCPNLDVLEHAFADVPMMHVEATKVDGRSGELAT
jgi:SAM-dependent methyltransferase